VNIHQPRPRQNFCAPDAQSQPSACPRFNAGSASAMRVRRKPIAREGRTRCDRCDRCGGRRVLVIGECIVPCPGCYDHEPNAARVLISADRGHYLDAAPARRAA